MAAKTIGLYGGTFDPLHFGHLNLAFEMLEKRKLDEVWFCPAKTSPHKLNDQPKASAEHRLKMLQLALAGITQFKVEDSEIKRGGISYTIDTLKSLLQREKDKQDPDQFFLILGSDSVPSFFDWRQPEEIVNLVPLLVGTRSSELDPAKIKGNPVICEAVKKGWTKIRIMEISATEVRERLHKGLYCGHMVPKEVLDYIYKNQLYFL